MESRLHSRVDVHVRCVESALGLAGHVVIGVCWVSPRRRNTLDGHVVTGVVFGLRNTKCRVLSFWIL